MKAIGVGGFGGRGEVGSGWRRGGSQSGMGVGAQFLMCLWVRFWLSVRVFMGVAAFVS